MKAEYILFPIMGLLALNIWWKSGGKDDLARLKRACRRLR